MSRPPNCDCAAAAAACAASGWVRSPAEALAAMPSAANSLTRSARPTALTSASNSLAPARPSPRATACPICPTRPTPVTRATFPWRSAGTDDVIHRGSTALREVHRVVAPDDVHGPLRSEEHTSELQSLTNLVCRLLLEKKNKRIKHNTPKLKLTPN